MYVRIKNTYFRYFNNKICVELEEEQEDAVNRYNLLYMKL